MKKRIVLFTAILLLLTAAFCSCNKGGMDEAEDGVEGVIYAPGTQVYISIQNDVSFEYVNAISDAIEAKTGVAPKLVAPDSEQHEHEITIGNTDKEISKKAYKRLERYMLDDGDDPKNFSRCVIYSDGSSIAIAYDDDEYDLAIGSALTYLINNYFSQKTLKVKSGVLYKETFDIIAHIHTLDEEYREEKWEELRLAAAQKAEPFYGAERAEEIADELVLAFQELYKMYSPKVVTWFANLYEPYVCICEDVNNCQKTKWCGGGGFYYSNSGRNSEGYLPDAESTSQALGFINSSGMARLYGSSYVKTITPEMRKAIPYFIKNLQEPNGFFYHPQWPMEDTDAHLSRRARDINWCTSMLSTFGYKPTYNTPTGVEGDGLLADGTPVNSVAPSAHLSSPLGTSAVMAVSKVISVADNTPAHLKDEASFREYLAQQDIHNSSYPVGNTLTAQSSQIKQTPGLMEILIEWLNENQNPATGHWDWKVEGDPGYSDYYGVNGLLKISGIYNTAKSPMPYAEQAAQSAIDAITADDPIGAVVDVYNTWFSISNILTNLLNYSEDKAAGQALADKIVASLLVQAPDAIRVSRDKLADFQKLDGSFSYGRNASSATSQGMPVAIPGTNEGDVNATVIATTGTLGNILSALQLSSYKVYPFGEAERRVFVNTLEKLQPVIKDSYDEVITYATFDDENIDSEPTEVEFKLGNASLGSYAKVVDDSRTEKSGEKVLEFKTAKGSGDYVYVDNNFSTAKAKCFVFEGDFCVLESNSDYVMQITMGSAYMFIFKVSGGKVNIWDASSSNGSKSQDTDLCLAPKLGEWFNLKVEYYIGDHDSVRIKFYYNGKLCAITDNYYNSSGSKLTTGTGTPSKSFDKVNIYAMNGANLRMQMDNLTAYCTMDLYVAPTENLPPINVDMPEGYEPEVEYATFDDSTVDSEPTEVTFKYGKPELGSSIKVVSDPRSENADGKVLELKTVSGSGDYVYVSNTMPTSRAKCLVFEGDFCVTKSNSDYVMQITMGSAYMFIFKVSGGKVNIWDASSTTGTNSQDTELCITPALGEWFNLRVEYYPGTHETVRIKVYYNDKLAAITDNYYNASGTKLTTGTGTPSKNYSSTTIYSMGSSVMTMYMDNLASYCKYNTEYTAPTENLPPVNVDMPDSPEKVYGFDSGVPTDFTTDASVVGVQVGTDTKNMLAVSGNTRIPVNIRTKGTNCGVTEMSLYCDSSVASGKTVGSLVYRDVSSGSTAMLGWNLKVATVNGVKYITLVEAPDGKAGAVVDNLLIPLGKLVKLRIDYYHTEDIAIIYLDGKFVTASSPMYKNASKYTFGKLDVTLPEGGVSGLYIESVKAERTVASFEEAVKPEIDRVTVDFSGSDSAEYLLGGATVETVSGDSYAKLDSEGGSAAIKVPMLHRSAVMTAAVMELKAKVISANTDGELYRFAFTDEDGNVEFALVLVKDGNKLELREGSLGGTRSVALGSVSIGEEFSLRVDLFPGKKLANIYVNDTCIAVSGVFYQGNVGAAEFDCVEISSLGTSAAVAIDDLVAETLYKYYTNEKLSASDSTGYVDGVLDFSDATTGKMPTSITTSLSTIGSAVRIEKVPTKNGQWSDVFAFDTSSGGNDGVVVASSASTDGKSCVAFEVDLCYSGTSTGDLYQIMFCGTSKGEKIAYMYNLKFTGGSFWMVDCSSTGDNGNRYENKITFPENVAKGEWFTLRVEYYTGTKDTVKMKTYINGTHVLTSDNYYGQLKDGNDKAFNNSVNYVKFYSLGSTSGTLRFSNITFEGTDDKFAE